MTDAASKAAEIVNKYLLDVAMPVGKLMHVESAILSAIESAVRAERERAGKLVEAIMDVGVFPETNCWCGAGGNGHLAPDDQHTGECKGMRAALQAYEVQP